ncbi:MAG: FliI/YscN family ATPase [Calditrichia bacterium]
MSELSQRFDTLLKKIDTIEPFDVQGRVSRLNGILIEATAIGGSIGSLCEIETATGRKIEAEIVGFKDQMIQLMALGTTLGMAPGNPVRIKSQEMTIKVGPALLGRIIDGLGKPLDGLGELQDGVACSLYNSPPASLDRERISSVFPTGVRAIDGLITFGRGQRVGIFAGSGVGKSVLLGMLAKHAQAEINVIALIGERGREVREFIERDLGEEALKHSVVIVSTSDNPPSVRIKAAHLATSIAEYFRTAGKDVLLMMDSLTRVAMAQREIGLAIGEPPTTKGYTPSVFTLLPGLLERAGTAKTGSITGVYTVLVEGDDMDEPISDAARSILDGHIVLKRDLAVQGHFPAIDVLESISRVKNDVLTTEQQQTTVRILERLAVYKQAEDLIRIGAYKGGTDPLLDQSIAARPEVLKFLRQQPDEASDFQTTQEQLAKLVAGGQK